MRVHSSSPSSRVTQVLLYLLAALGSLTIDLYLPALPDLRSGLHVSTAATQLTLSATTIGFAVGLLVAGNWSDSVGRRLPLIVGTGVHVLASAGVAAAPNIEWILAFRFLQGVGAAASGVAATAILRDLFSGSAFVRMLARRSAVSGLMPVVAPILGSQLLQVLNWREVFLLVASYGLVVLVLSVVGLQETLPPDRRLPMRPRALMARHRELALNREFVGLALIGSLIVAGVFAMMTASSFLLQGTLALDSGAYAIAFACNAVAFVIGTQSSAALVQRTSPQRVLAVSLPLSSAAGFATMPSGSFGVVAITASTAMFMLGAGLSAPCIQVLALASQGHQAGTAAAALGASNFALAGVTAPIVGALGVTSTIPMGLIMGVGLALAAAAFWGLVRPRRSAIQAVQPRRRLRKPKPRRSPEADSVHLVAVDEPCALANSTQSFPSGGSGMMRTPSTGSARAVSTVAEPVRGSNHPNA
jgi:DHA1 family bicyclomycin/chloramphenicol resistance-like MFS transporter